MCVGRYFPSSDGYGSFGTEVCEKKVAVSQKPGSSKARLPWAE